MASGAEVIYPLEDQFYGERGGRLRDPFGQQWMMSQHIKYVTAEEMARLAAAFFSRQRPEASAVLATAYLPELVTPLTASANTRR